MLKQFNFILLFAPPSNLKKIYMNKYYIIDKNGFQHFVNADILQIEGVQCMLISNDCSIGVVAVFYEPISVVKVN